MTAAWPGRLADPPLVVGLGEFLWDLLPDGKQPGGAPANFASHVNQLGGRGIIVSAVGDDALGKELLAWLEVTGLSTDYVHVQPDHATSTVSVNVDQGGQPRFTIHENVAWDFLQWHESLRTLAQRADSVCVGSLAQRSPQSAETIVKFLSATRPDCLRIFDLNLRQHYFNFATIDRTLARCPILKLNDEEWPVIGKLMNVGLAVPDGPRELMEKYGLSLVALTRGRYGSILITPDRVLDQPGGTVNVKDTVGAGDSFTATLAFGLLRRRSLDQVHRQADAVARYVCTQSGGTPRLPRELIELNPTSDV